MDLAINTHLTSGLSLSSDVKPSQHASAAFQFIKETFATSARAPCGSEHMTLTLAVDAPAASLRCMALQELDAMATAASPEHRDTQDFLHSVVQRRLRDDSWEVVLVAAGLTALQALPAEQLLPSLEAALQRAAEVLAGGGSSGEDLGTVRRVVKRLFKAMQAVAVRQPQLAGRVLCQHLGFLLLSRWNRKVAAAALRSAQGVGHPLSTPLEALGITDAVASPSSASKVASSSSKDKAARKAAREQQAATDLEFNRQVVRALSDHLAANPADVHDVVELLDGANARAKHVLLAVLSHALTKLAANAAGKSAASGKGSSAKAAAAAAKAAGAALAAVFAQARSMLPTSNDSGVAGGQFAGAHLPYYDAQGLPTADVYQDTFVGMSAASLSLLPQAIKAALSAVSPELIVAHVGTPGEVFAQLARFHPREAFREHLELLISRMTAHSPFTFLSEIFAAPDDVHDEDTRANALEVAASSATNIVQPQSGSEASVIKCLLRVLGCLCSNSSALRCAALRCLKALAPVLQSQGARAIDGSNLSGLDAAALLAAVQEPAELIELDGASFERLLSNTMSPGSTSSASSAPAPKPRKLRSAAAGAPSGVDKDEEMEDAEDMVGAVALNMQPAAVSGWIQALLAQLPQLPTSQGASSDATSVSSSSSAAEADLAVLQLALVVLSAASSLEALFGAGHVALARLLPLIAGHAFNSGIAQHQALQIAVQLVQLYTQGCCAAAPTEALDTFVTVLCPAGDTAPSSRQAAAGGGTNYAGSRQAMPLEVLRAVGLQQVSAPLFTALPASHQPQVFKALLLAATSAVYEPSRVAAREALDALPLAPTALVPWLACLGGGSGAAAGPAAPAAKIPKTRAKSAKQAANADAAHGAMDLGADTATVDAAVGVLEMLQWKDYIQGFGALVPALQRALRFLLPLMGSIASSYTDHDDADAEATIIGAPAAAETPAGLSQGSPTAGYACQLILLCLNRITADPGSGADLSVWQLDLVVQAAQEAPDGAVRNAALVLLTNLAGKLPQDTLTHVLQVRSLGVAAGLLAA